MKRLPTPFRIREFQSRLYYEAKPDGACLAVKGVGKPYAGKLHVRCDEGALVTPDHCGSW